MWLLHVAHHLFLKICAWCSEGKSSVLRAYHHVASMFECPRFSLSSNHLFILVEGGYKHVIVYMWSSEDNLWESVLSAHCVGSRDQLHALRLYTNGCPPTSHPQ